MTTAMAPTKELQRQRVEFPLPDDYFQPISLTSEEERRIRQLVLGIRLRTVNEERPVLDSRYTQVDFHRWKIAKVKDQLRVYRETLRSDDSSSPSRGARALAIGTIDGTLEEVLLGLHHKNTREMRASTAFLNPDFKDTAVLHTLEPGSDKDPFRLLAVKWRVVDTPGGGLVKNRDGCFLDYIGMDRDESGRRYGFHIIEAFEHPACPPFQSKHIIRAEPRARYIYRQLNGNRVGVFVKADFSFAGKLPSFIARRSLSTIIVAVSKSLACTEAKKLTRLALRSSPPLPHTQSQVCGICQTASGRLYFSTRSTSACHICGVPVCSRCRVTKYLLAQPQLIKAACCKQCIMDAKQVAVDPRQPMALISLDQWSAPASSSLSSEPDSDSAWALSYTGEQAASTAASLDVVDSIFSGRFRSMSDISDTLSADIERSSGAPWSYVETDSWSDDDVKPTPAPVNPQESMEMAYQAQLMSQLQKLNDQVDAVYTLTKAQAQWCLTPAP